MIATTGGWFSKLSDTKKGVVAIVSTMIVGFALGSMTITQVGIPQRVEVLEAITQVGIPQRVNVLEADHILLRGRVTAMEVSDEAARVEREYIIDVLSWTTCAIEADADDVDIRGRCGSAPLWGGD
jgi:hypothetical protein